MSDLSDQQFAEIVRDRLVKQLTFANEQLEQFAYAASHDLREPLRTIVCFSELLETEYGDKLEDAGKEYLLICKRAALKMEAIVADLLEYGRLGQSAERYTEVDSKKALAEALDALSESIQSTRADVQSGPLPIVFVHPLRFSRLLQNLIGNALKYQPADHAPVVRITAKEQSEDWLFTVSDNGIGISQEYLETIFAPFKRLHNDQEFAGNGIGLSICRRIVEGFGGRIYAESVLGTGSTFLFTIPKREPNPHS